MTAPTLTTSNSPTHYAHGTLAVRIFFCFAFGYLLSYALRSVNAVIAPELLRDLQLNSSDLGLLSAAYLLSFALMQLPLGVCLDRFGSRRVEATLLLFAAAGAALFALSTSFAGLWLGRALIGMGVSACLMAPFKAYREWFAPERQAQIAAYMLVAGTSGALLATEPVHWLIPTLGWRGVFWGVCILLLLSSAAIYFFLPKPREELNAPAPIKKNWLTDYKPIFSNAYFWKLAPIGFVHQSGFIALQTLWIGPWMVQVLGYSPEATARLLLIFNFVLLLSYLNLSWLAPRMARKKIPITTSAGIGLALCIFFQGSIVFAHGTHVWLLWPMMAIFAVATTIVQTGVSLAFPPSYAGRANAGFNVLIFISAFIWQWGLGLLIDVFKQHGMSHDHAMRTALGLFVACQVIALLAFLLNPAKPPQVPK